MMRCVSFVCLLALTSSAVAADPVDYIRQVQPLLKKRCYECHGPDKKESGLRLDSRQEALAGGDSGPAIVAGDAAGSLLVKLVGSDDPEKVMPPKGDALSRSQIELLKRWIDEGAKWPED